MSTRTTFLSTLITAGSIVLGGSLLMATSPRGSALITPSTSPTPPSIAPGAEDVGENSRQAARDKIYLEEHPGEKIEDSTQDARNKFYYEKHAGATLEDSSQSARDKVYLEKHPGENIEDSTQEARNKYYIENHPFELMIDPIN